MAIKQKIKLGKLEEAKLKAEHDYQGGGAYKAFLKLFYKNKIEQDKKKDENDTGHDRSV
tara:strand:+ start:650 stop:826 length:177 start_codon:yes stop_codon:yes gene_type:complete